MGGNSKSFSAVLERANKHLKLAMGYEIVELMSRTEREQLLTKTKHGKQGKGTSAPSFDSIPTLLVTL
jgi:MAGE family